MYSKIEGQSNGITKLENDFSLVSSGHWLDGNSTVLGTGTPIFTARQLLKNAALCGTAVVNNPFWWSADEKFFNNCLAVKIGAPYKTLLNYSVYKHFSILHQNVVSCKQENPRIQKYFASLKASPDY